MVVGWLCRRYRFEKTIADGCPSEPCSGAQDGAYRHYAEKKHLCPEARMLFPASIWRGKEKAIDCKKQHCRKHAADSARKKIDGFSHSKCQNQTDWDFWKSDISLKMV